MTMPYKPVGADENGKFPPRVEAVLSATYGPDAAGMKAKFGSKTHVVVGPSGDYATLAEAYAANPGGNVDIELTAGEHALAATLTPVGVKNVIIRGQGRGATTLNCAAGFINASGSADAWEVYGLTIKRNAGTNTNNGIEVDYPRRWSVHHCTIQGFGGASVKYKGGVQSNISFNYMAAEDSSNTNGLAGIHITKADGASGEVATTMTTMHNYIVAGVQYGLLFDGTTIGSVSISDIAEACAVGFRFVNSAMTVINPYTEGNTVGIEYHDSYPSVIGRIRDEPVLSWSGTGVFDRRAVRIAGNWINPGKGLVYGGSTGATSFDTAPSLRWDNTSPNGRLTSPIGSMTLRPDGGAGSTLYVKESGTGNTGWVPLGTRTATTASLASAASTINVIDKLVGVQVWNSTLNRPVWATGTAATAIWVFADGTTAHTPA